MTARRNYLPEVNLYLVFGHASGDFDHLKSEVERVLRRKVEKEMPTIGVVSAQMTKAQAEAVEGLPCVSGIEQSLIKRVFKRGQA